MGALGDYAKGNALGAFGINSEDNRYEKNYIGIPLGRIGGSGAERNVMNFRFLVWVESEFMAFQSVSGLSEVKDYEYIVEGGNNNFPRALRSPKAQPEQLTFKRGYRIRKVGISNLLKGFDGELFDDDNVCMIFVLDREGKIDAMYSFVTMGLTKWELSDLDAMKGQQMIETYTVNHRGITKVPVPWFNFDDPITGLVKAIVDQAKEDKAEKKSKVSTDSDGNTVTKEDNYTKTDYKKPVVDMSTGQRIVVKSKKENSDGTVEYTDINGKVTKYDPKTGQTTSKDVHGNTVVTTKDGNVKTYKPVKKTEVVNGVEKEVDALELVKESDNGKVTEFNDDGSVKKVTDENGAVTTYKDGKPERTVQKNGAVTTYYDDHSITTEKNGYVTKQDKYGNEITMDSMDNIVKTKTVTPDGGYIEEKNGVTTQVDADGNKTVKDKDGNIVEDQSGSDEKEETTDRGNVVTRDEKGNVTDIS